MNIQNKHPNDAKQRENSLAQSYVHDYMIWINEWFNRTYNDVHSVIGIEFAPVSVKRLV